MKGISNSMNNQNQAWICERILALSLSEDYVILKSSKGKQGQTVSATEWGKWR